MERKSSFNFLMETQLSRERMHLIKPARTYDEAKANVEYVGRKILDFFTPRRQTQINNYLLLINDPLVLAGYAPSKKVEDNFSALRKVAVEGFSLYFLLQEATPALDEVDDWEELQKMNLLIQRLSEGSLSQLNGLPISYFAQKDDKLMELISQNG